MSKFWESGAQDPDVISVTLNMTGFRHKGVEAPLLSFAGGASPTTWQGVTQIRNPTDVKMI